MDKSCSHHCCPCLEMRLLELERDNDELRKILTQANKLHRASRLVCLDVGDRRFEQDVWVANYQHFTFEVDQFTRLKKRFRKRKVSGRS